MRQILVVVVGLLGACALVNDGPDVQFCYDGEHCSHATPYGLEFRGTDVTGDDPGRPGVLAIGGTQRIVLLDPTEDSFSPRPFERPYEVDTSMSVDDRFGLGVDAKGQEANVVTVRGIADGVNYLRILDFDGRLYGRTVLAAHAVVRRQVRPPEVFAYDGPDEEDAVVWVPGTHDIRVALWADARQELGPKHRRLVDESLVLEMPGATQKRWDTIEVAATTAGTRQLVVTGGSGSALLDIETVAAPDGIEDRFDNYYPLSTSGSDRLCFIARHGTRYVAGVEWSFEMEGGMVLTTPTTETIRSGCAYFAARRQGLVQIRATASGYTQTFDVMAK